MRDAQWTRSVRTLLLAGGVAGVLAACQDLFVEPALDGDTAAFALTLVSNAALSAGDADAFDKAEVARIRLERANGAVVQLPDEELPAPGSERVVEVDVEIEGDSESLQLHTQLLWSGNVLFEGSASVVLERGQTADVDISLAPVAARIDAPTTAAPITTIGGTLQLTGTVVYATGDAVDNTTVTWTSLDEGIATVTPQGLVTARAEGAAAIVASYDELQNAVQVTVAAEVAVVDVEPASMELIVGSERQATGTARDANGNVLNRTPAWESSAPEIAMVGATGVVRAVSAGTAMVTARVEGITSAGIEVRVSDVPVAAVTVQPDAAELLVGASMRIEATTRDAAGNLLTGRSVQWQSTNLPVAAVDANGVVTAAAEGQAIIIATSEGTADSAAISVVRPIIEASPNPISVAATVGTDPPPTPVTIRNAGTGTLTGLTAAIAYEGATQGWLSVRLSATTAPATLTLDIDSSELPEGVYNATVTTSSNQSGVAPLTLPVQLSLGRVPVERVTIEPAAATLLAGETVQLAVVAYDEHGNELSGRPVSSTSSQPNVANVASLLVTAIAEGQATITATIEGVSATSVITVVQPRIVLTPGNVHFEANVGQNPQPQNVTITNGGTGTLVVNGVPTVTYRDETGPWLDIDLIPQENGGSLMLSPDVANIPAGAYAATVTVRSSQTGVQAVDLSVALNVTQGEFYELAVTVVGNGTISGSGIDCTSNESGICRLDVAAGTRVNLTALAATDHRFYGWEWDAISGACTHFRSNPICSFEMTSDAFVIAGFWVPSPDAPVISDVTGTLTTLNDPSCTNGGSLFTVSLSYADANRNVTQAGTRVTEAWRFEPSGNTGAFDANATIDGDGSTGTITYLACFVFNSDTQVRGMVSIRDASGFPSNSITYTVNRPVGANGRVIESNGASGSPVSARSSSGNR